MEKNLKIKTPDKHIIYGILRMPEKGKAKTLVVHVHGLTGSPNEHFHYNGAEEKLFAETYSFVKKYSRI